MAAFSDTAFDTNAFSDQSFSFAFVPPIPPTPKPKRRDDVGGGYTKQKFYDASQHVAKLRKIQDDDDLDVVKVLTEFLSRQ